MIGLAEAGNSRLSNAFKSSLEFGFMVMKELDENARFRDVAIESFVTQFIRLDLDLMLAAYILDPNRMFYLTPKALKRGKEYILQLLLDMGQGKEILEPLKKEMKRYFEVAKSLKSYISDIYSWWTGSSTLILKIVALRLAACHASSANTERIFSALNRVITPDRNRLSLDTISDLMTVRIYRLSKQQNNKMRSRSSPQKVLQQALQQDSQGGSQNSRQTSQVPVQNENEAEQEEVLGDFCSEAPILDPEILRACGDISDDSEEFFSSEKYLQFVSLIDYTSRPLDDIVVPETINRRRWARSARDVLNDSGFEL